MKPRPVLFTWNGEHMVPHPRFVALCNKQFVVPEEYALEIVENVSGKSRAHFFAALHDSWDSLPETTAKRFPSFEHFRKWILVQVGHRTQTDYALSTAKDAQKMARGLRAADEYAVIVVSDNVVIYSTAKSIAANAIKKDEFQIVKTNALDLAAEMVGVKRSELQKNAGRAA